MCRFSMEKLPTRYANAKDRPNKLSWMLAGSRFQRQKTNGISSIAASLQQINAYLAALLILRGNSAEPVTLLLQF